ncbi:hypothetical protein TNCV_4589131 [Trichonephila clavipes]|nr:hypothetical protein TNCV_4589131 [Trichonephila clavipes]
MSGWILFAYPQSEIDTKARESESPRDVSLPYTTLRVQTSHLRKKKLSQWQIRSRTAIQACFERIVNFRVLFLYRLFECHRCFRTFKRVVQRLLKKVPTVQQNVRAEVQNTGEKSVDVEMISYGVVVGSISSKRLVDDDHGMFALG